tara:strand:+ start:1278 stop:1739 length:462 start_codon:yes stop_codon:yes gene_type:complete
VYYEAYNNRAGIYGYLGKYEDAIADYTRAIEIKPEVAKTYCSRGLAKELLGLSYCSDYKKSCDLGYKKCCKNYNKCRSGRESTDKVNFDQNHWDLSYNDCKARGYRGSKKDFAALLDSSESYFNLAYDNHTMFNGYTGSKKDFIKLLGIKNKW